MVLFAKIDINQPKNKIPQVTNKTEDTNWMGRLVQFSLLSFGWGYINLTKTVDVRDQYARVAACWEPLSKLEFFVRVLWNLNKLQWYISK